MNMDFFWKGWEWISWMLDQPSVWFAAAINYAPKTALVVAVVIAMKAMF